MSESRTEHKKGDERTAAWRYCECRVCRELREEEESLREEEESLLTALEQNNRSGGLEGVK